jgi:subtilase family serine protease
MGNEWPGRACLVLAMVAAAMVAAGCSSARPSKHTTPAEQQQAAKLTAAATMMRTHYIEFADSEPGAADVLDYNLGALWRQGVDGAGTTVAVIEGWDDPQLEQQMAVFDSTLGLPAAQISTIYPTGARRLPATCPPGMQALGSYGSCTGWGGELLLDVMSVHLVAPYAKILIAVAPADSEITDDAASQVAPPEMMQAVEQIARRHLANVISISDGSGEGTYSHGAEEISAQDPGELAAAAAGIPLLVATGDCAVVQALPEHDAPCTRVTSGRQSATWDDSPWVTAVGGSTPNLSLRGARLGPDKLWNLPGRYGTGAGLSAVFARPGYQDGVASSTKSSMRSVPDLVMDATHGTSEAAPLLAGVLALATQQNHGRNVGPINPLLYQVLGPAGARDGIADVVSGNNSVTTKDGRVLVPGFAAAPGFDVVSGWGTINAAKFVPALAAATEAAHQDTAVRNQAAAALRALEQVVALAPPSVGAGGVTMLSAGGFLPGHPVRLAIDGRHLRTLTASPDGVVTARLSLAGLGLAAGQHTVTLTSMLITKTAKLTVR